MRSRARFPVAFFIGVVGALLLYASASLALDPLRVFGTTGFNRKNFEPNARYLQIVHLEHDPVPDAFVLGSSRVNFYDVALLRRLTADHYYNLSASIEGFQGIRRKVAWLLAHRRVRAVVIGLDYDLYDVRDDRADVQHVDAPAINGESPLEYYTRALLVPPEFLRDCVIGNLSRRTAYTFDPADGQFWVAPGDFDQGEHLVDRARLPRAVALGELRQTLALLDAAHVRHVEIVPPYSERRLMQFPSADYLQWLRDVVAVAGTVWDFGDDNTVARDPADYLDISHFDGRVGDWVLSRIFRGPGDGVPPGFGVEVTPRNLTAHLQRVRLALSDARQRLALARPEPRSHLPGD